MPVWSESTMDVVYYTADVAWDNQPCVVRIDGGVIVVEYQNEGLVTYSGTELAPGHFLLHSDDEDGPASASLHITPGHLVLEGSWQVIVPGQLRRGLWKIFLQGLQAP